MDESLGLGDSSERKFMNNVTYLYGKTVPDKSKPIFQIYFNSGLVDEEGFFLIPGTRFYIQAINHSFHNHSFHNHRFHSPSGQRLPTKIEAEELIMKNLDYILTTANSLGWYEFNTAINFSYRFWTSDQDSLGNAYCFYLDNPQVNPAVNKGSYAWTLYIKEKL